MAILGVSHFVATTPYAASLAARLCDVQVWSPGLTALNVPIDPGKEGYLAFEQADHDLRVLHHESSSPGVEFVRYARVTSRAAHYRVVFGHEDPVAFATRLVADNVLSDEQSGVVGDVPWYGPPDAPAALFVLRVAAMERAWRFWGEGIGFRRVADVEERGCLLGFGSFVRAWRNHLLLVPGGGPRPSGMLDDHGWNCVSLLVDDPTIVGRRLMDFGGSSLTPEIRLPVMGKDGMATRELRLTFIRGPEGEIVELLAVTSLLDAK